MHRRASWVSVFTLITAMGLAAQQSSDKNAPDLVGEPDLIVRTDMIEAQWVVRTERLAATACSVIEGGITPGDRLLVRFTVGTANIGDADIFIGDPNDHVEAGDGLFEFAACHNHYHFRNYTLYELVDPDTGDVWRAAKRGFCMLDTDPNPAWLGSPAGPGFYRSCGAVGIPGNQGISANWTDTYRFFLGGQYFVLDGGDGQDPVPPGQYIIRVTANPPFVEVSGEACPYKDSSGLCHMLPESDYGNNVGEVRIEIPDHPGRTGVGPASGTNAVSEPNTCRIEEIRGRK